MATALVQKRSSHYKITDTNAVLDGAREYILTVKDLPSEEKPREKLAVLGPRHLELPELVAIVLGVGTRKEEVLSMAKRIIREYGEKAIVHETDPQKLATSLDIPLSKASQIIAAFEIGRRFFAQKAGKPIFIRNADQAYAYLQDMAHSNKEQLRGLYLNSRRELVHDEVISVGSLTANIVHPREVFEPAIVNGAAAVIVAHNHPSDDPTPTPPDITVTRQLIDAGEALGISLLDHLIVVTDTYKSIMEEL